MKVIFDLYIYGITILIFGFIIIGNIIRLWYFIKCFNIKKCSNRKCRNKSYCDKYEHVWTTADREHLRDLINSLDSDMDTE